jgi:hypothetical protein
VIAGHRHLRTYFAEALERRLGPDEIPIRFAVTRRDAGSYHCELGVLRGLGKTSIQRPCSIFGFQPRPLERIDRFTGVLLIPTGIGAEIGGHAGDAGPVAKLLASVCDVLITHPNVVNASDINELPENGLYVEGSVLCRLLQGTAALQPVRSNRVLFVVDSHEDQSFTDAAINSLNAARACYGLQCPRVLELREPVVLKAEYTSSGLAAGRVEGFERLMAALDPYRGEFDAIALASIINVPPSYHEAYFGSAGKMVNPWGGVEAIYTHVISMLYNVPAAHSPMLESEEVLEIDSGVVDPRMAAEAVSYTFLQCILKGLGRSPRILSDPEAMRTPGAVTAADVSVVVIPDGCLGLPVLAALEQGIPVIGVRENRNLMANDTAALPWAPGQYTVVDNYLEAAGILCAMKAGIAPGSVRRPLPLASVTVTPAIAAGVERQLCAVGDSST